LPDEAFDTLFADFVVGVMSLADDPGHCAEYIATELRALIAAKAVFVYELSAGGGWRDCSLVSIVPERRRALAADPRLAALLEEGCKCPGAEMLAANSAHPAAKTLGDIGLGDSIVVPLRYSSRIVGLILILGLMDEANMDSLLRTLDRLAPILALILRNGQLFGHLETEVAKRTEELEKRRNELEFALREKETLLREIHHRVKNNLQVVSSLLALRGRTESPEIRALFEDSQNRIEAMALVHEEIYRSGDYSAVHMDDYLGGLARKMLYCGPPGIHMDFSLEPLKLSLDEAIPCGLAVNELVMNSIKHAFRSRGGGRIGLSLRSMPEGVEIGVEDDGPGLGDARETSPGSHIGLSIVRILAEQLGGSLDFPPGPGARVRLKFKPSSLR